MKAHTTGFNPDYSDDEPSRGEVDALAGPAVVELGAPWCGYCRVAEPWVEQALVAHPNVAHIKVHDGRGKPLGRSFGVKLWPTLIFLRDGQEVARMVRPTSAEPIAKALAQIT